METTQRQVKHQAPYFKALKEIERRENLTTRSRPSTACGKATEESLVLNAPQSAAVAAKKILCFTMSNGRSYWNNNTKSAYELSAAAHIQLEIETAKSQVKTAMTTGGFLDKLISST